MASRVLLISTNRCTAPDPVFPLGLAQLSAALRGAGHQTRWLDALAGYPPLEEVLTEFEPDLVGVSLRNIDDVLIRKRETYFDDLPALCAKVHELAQCPVVLGGSGFSIFPGELLAFTGADFGVCGEGEETLLALIAGLESGGQSRELPGLVWRDGEGIVVNRVAAGAAAVRSGLADRPAAVTAYYLRTGGMLNVQTQRGCAFRCCYCTYPVIEGRAHRRYPPETVADEFAELQRLGARYVFITDSIFNSSPRHVTDVCEAIIRRNLKLSWGCFLRPQGLDVEIMKLMARAGLAHAEFGSDSLSDEVLAAYQKGLTFDDIFKSSEAARAAGVDSCHFLICGGPGETRETLRGSFERSQRLPGGVVMAVVGMRIYPGTPLFERAVAEGRIRSDVNLLSPIYYLSHSLTAEEVFEQLREFSRRSPSWIPGDPSPEYTRLVERLRRRGVVGPLWSYVSMIQRLWPDGVAAAHAATPTSGAATAVTPTGRGSAARPEMV